MVHLAYVFLGKFFWIYRLICDYISDYIFGFFYGGKHQPLPPIKNPVLLESASSLAKKIRTQQLKSVDVVKAYIDRIREVNIIINALVDQRFAEAILEAQKADAVVASGQMSVEQLAKQLPFLGIPFTTKECFNVKGLRQTGGLISRKCYVSDVTAPVVEQLINCGAILLGVCNTPQLCSWAETHNHVYGRTSNSYDTGRTCGGSTGGDGTLISACGSLLAIGTDIGGSVRIPSLFNGIFGHKPTSGCVLLDGMLPPSDGDLSIYNTYGPLCRYAEDLIPVFKCLLKSNTIADKLQLDQPVDLKTLKIFYQEDDGGSPFVTPTDTEIKSAMHRAISHLEKMYGIKAVKVNIREFYDTMKMYGSAITSGANTTLSALLADGKGEVNVFAEFFKILVGCSDHTFPLILACMYEKIFNKDAAFIQEMESKRNALKSQMRDLLGDNGVFFYPTHPTPALYHHQMVVRPINFSYTGLTNILGLPSTHCPMGLNSKGLPIGFQVIGNMFKDRLTLTMAKELERAFGGWVPPCTVQCQT